MSNLAKVAKARAEDSVDTLLARRNALMGPNAPLLYESPLYLTEGRGVWLFDDKGRRYLDAYNNVPHVGHSHPAVVEAVTKQLGMLNTHSRYVSKVVLDYHEQLLSIVDLPQARGVLTCTGSESNELALRMARHITGHAGIIVTDYTYHGNTAAVAELSTAFDVNPTGLPNYIRAIRAPALPPKVQRGEGSPTEETLKAAYLKEVKDAIAYFDSHGIGVAAILLDPIFSTDGLPDVVPGFVKEAVELVHQAGGLYIADEVQPGLGRCGETWWGYQLHDAQPDIITLGKPLGNGYPVAGLIGRAEIVDRFRSEVMYFNTFGATPVACAAGSAVLQVIERENLIDNARETGSLMLRKLSELTSKHDCIGDVRGKGLFIGVELVEKGGRYEPDSKMAKRVIEGMRNEGVLISKIGKYDNVLKIRPPMPFTAEHVTQFVDSMDLVLSNLR
ncbi:class III aminotransferase [Caballeronia hypogeia]|uniref:Class III aminotransferase n=1 Tax=Caballeronia hypogeia TaxID=1777140 RepID=A0A158CJA8_9BURK|nr:aspartate aminotransferase family protein [Caballeronia hypogeia]SAK82361.1 class III aminotransferase [Caballeronia hypogeia]